MDGAKRRSHGLLSGSRLLRRRASCHRHRSAPPAFAPFSGAGHRCVVGLLLCAAVVVCHALGMLLMGGSPLFAAPSWGEKGQESGGAGVVTAKQPGSLDNGFQTLGEGTNGNHPAVPEDAGSQASSAPGSREKVIYIMSDSTGETAQLLLSRVLVQYPRHMPQVRVHSHIRTLEQIVQVMTEAHTQRPNVLVLATVVDAQRNAWIRKLAGTMDIHVINIMEPMLQQFNDFLESEAVGSWHKHPRKAVGRPGVSGGINQTKVNDMVNKAYFKMIEAVTFAQTHVAGLNSEGWPAADVILLGPSRVGKTAISHMLAERGMKAACIDVTAKDPLPPELDRLDPARVVLLTYRQEALLVRRQKRLHEFKRRKLPLLLDHDYASEDTVRKELEFVEKVARLRPQWHRPIDCTDLAVEDCSTAIAHLVSQATKKAAN